MPAGIRPPATAGYIPKWHYETPSIKYDSEDLGEIFSQAKQQGTLVAF